MVRAGPGSCEGPGGRAQMVLTGGGSGIGRGDSAQETYRTGDDRGASPTVRRADEFVAEPALSQAQQALSARRALRKLRKSNSIERWEDPIFSLMHGSARRNEGC